MRNYFLQTSRIGFSRWSKDDLQLAQLLWGNSEVTQYICASGRFTVSEVTARLTKEIEGQSQF